MTYDLPRRLVAEALGTGLLLATVVGSGIMAEDLAGGNAAVALLGNTIATGAMLAVLILVFGPISGAHLNPAVTLVMGLRRALAWREAPAYVAAQVAGGLVGVVTAHLMFGLPAVFASATTRTGPPQWLGEAVATFGLIATILGCARFRAEAVPYAVGLFITAGYWFTSSTSFANPAVTIGRAFSDTFSGIRPVDVPGFIAAQLVGAGLAAAVIGWLLKAAPSLRAAHRQASGTPASGAQAGDGRTAADAAE